MRVEDTGLKWKYALTPIKSVKKIVAHHPAHPTWDINDIHKAHQNKGWNGIGYNYFITQDGRIQLGRGMNVGAHCEGHNSNTLGVSFQGNFEIQIPTEAQYRTGAKLIAKLLTDARLSIQDVIGHRDLAATVCPGKNFDVRKLRDYISEELNSTKGVIQVADNQEYIHTHNDKVMIDLLSKYGYMAKSFKIPSKEFAQMLSIPYLIVKDLEDKGVISAE
ncbi:peptidoglycan recognition protein family protein [Metabacillus litoralis]|uniref:peptidoglycan recognition protein family protein n=1 Tax=Metabacillus litoralis TaxID=152268 RepID=UPI00203CCF66|nr:peptidoglycan recognition protein family protein [Metabacillus litoralis]